MTEFRTTTPLLPHQIPAVAKMLPIRVGALFMDMGLGKTRVALEVAARRQGKWNRLFWFTPCSLRRNVLRQILEHTDLPETAVCIWDSAAIRKLESLECLMHIIGIETMGSSNVAVSTYAGLVTANSFVVVDESSYIKGFLAKRTQRITTFSDKARYRLVLTGTPFTQGPVDLYAQMKFLSPKILGYKSFWSFAANHLEYETKKIRGRRVRTGRIIRSHNTEYLAAKIAPYVYQVKKDECIDLPDKLHKNVWLTLTGEQERWYEKAKEDFLMEEDPDDWSSIALFRLFGRLQTIVCGFVKVGEEHKPLKNNRIETLLNVLGGIGCEEKVLVWAKYRFCVEQVRAAIGREYGPESVRAFHGDMPDREREKALAEWRTGGARYLVLTQSLGSHGLTLNEAAYAVFYADSFKYSERLQAEDRIHRIGQTRRPTYITLLADSSIDVRIANALARKGDALESFQEEVQECRTKGLRERMLEMVRAL